MYENVKESKYLTWEWIVAHFLIHPKQFYKVLKVLISISAASSTPKSCSAYSSSAMLMYVVLGGAKVS